MPDAPIAAYPTIRGDPWARGGQAPPEPLSVRAKSLWWVAPNSGRATD
jgi:hypothetical protein